MNILFDISSSKITNTGISVYQTELIKELKRIEDLCIFEVWYEPMFSRNTKLRSIDSFYRDLLWQGTAIEKKARKVNADVIHFPAYNFPVSSNQKMLITVHDIYSIIQPGFYRRWHAKVVNKYINAAVKQQRHIVVPSYFVKNEILQYFPAANDACLHVVHSGISNLRYRFKDDRWFQRLSVKYKIHKPYILSVSTIEPRKNFLNLIRAFAQIAHSTDHNLVLVGQSGWKNKEIYDLIRDKNLGNRVCFTGFVDDKELNLLYSHATCFVFPSHYEGFGFTPLEAMKCGCPVVSSNASCMPEVLGDAAIFFEPTDVEAIGKAILKLLGDTQLQNELSDRGILHSQQYSWQKTALKTSQLYYQLNNQNAPALKIS